MSDADQRARRGTFEAAFAPGEAAVAAGRLALRRRVSGAAARNDRTALALFGGAVAGIALARAFAGMPGALAARALIVCVGALIGWRSLGHVRAVMAYMRVRRALGAAIPSRIAFEESGVTATGAQDFSARWDQIDACETFDGVAIYYSGANGVALPVGAPRI